MKTYEFRVRNRDAADPEAPEAWNAEADTGAVVGRALSKIRNKYIGALETRYSHKDSAVHPAPHKTTTY